MFPLRVAMVAQALRRTIFAVSVADFGVETASQPVPSHPEAKPKDLRKCRDRALIA